MKKKIIAGLLLLSLVSVLGCGTAGKVDEAVSEAVTSKETASAATNTEKKVEESFPAPVSYSGRSEDQTENLLPKHSYKLSASHEVDGRQGIAWADGKYYVSGSTELICYDSEWKKTASTDDPFKGFENEVNHIGDIDVYNGEIYAGVEYFMDGEAKNIQIAVYDADTLEMKRSFPFEEASGQTEVSGIAVDPDSRTIWMCSWADGESGRYLYRYDLDNGSYLGKWHLQAPPQWIQGVTYYDGFLYITADDGTADLGEPDHIYRCSANPDGSFMTTALERTLDDVTLQGEIEGLSFDREQGQMLVSYNRGARIVLGMPRGFYEGYDKELHEIFVYDIQGL